MNNVVTYYNREIFDKFAISYPRDGITWEEMAALAQKVSRVDNGVQYYGYSTSVNHMVLTNQLSIPLCFARSG